jgi:hypothetical protein
MSDIQTLTFGTTVVNLAAVVTMSEEEFKNTFRGILSVDLNDAWKEVKKHQPKQPAKKAKKYFNKED